MEGIAFDITGRSSTGGIRASTAFMRSVRHHSVLCVRDDQDLSRACRLRSLWPISSAPGSYRHRSDPAWFAACRADAVSCGARCDPARDVFARTASCARPWTHRRLSSQRCRASRRECRCSQHAGTRHTGVCLTALERRAHRVMGLYMDEPESFDGGARFAERDGRRYRVRS